MHLSYEERWCIGVSPDALHDAGKTSIFPALRYGKRYTQDGNIFILVTNPDLGTIDLGFAVASCGVLSEIVLKDWLTSRDMTTQEALILKCSKQSVLRGVLQRSKAHRMREKRKEWDESRGRIWIKFAVPSNAWAFQRTLRVFHKVNHHYASTIWRTVHEKNATENKLRIEGKRKLPES